MVKKEPPFKTANVFHIPGLRPYSPDTMDDCWYLEGVAIVPLQLDWDCIQHELVEKNGFDKAEAAKLIDDFVEKIEVTRLARILATRIKLVAR